MRYPSSFLEEIKNRLPVSSVVSSHVKLKKTGKEYSGLSPFNKEKSPSFTVNDQKGFYHCFSSGKHGSVFDFLVEVEGLTFVEAIEKCAGLAGLTLPTFTPEQKQREEVRATLYDVMDLATRFFEEQLQSAKGAKARGYLVTRGLSPKVQLKFKLGYSPNERFALRDYLASKKITTEQMIACGLLIHGDDIAVPYDRFRDRLMFPIHDFRGKVIAFGGRALEKDVPAKYLNSPETELFHKGHTLYHGHIAKIAAHRANRLIVVEGYMDVIALASAGIEEVVAPLGTALTADQLQLLWGMEDAPVLLFDGDRAGQKAAYRAVDMGLTALKPSKTLQFCALPNNQDPDDLIKNEGRAALESLLSKAIPLADKVWERETAFAVFETPEQKAALEARLKQIAFSIEDESLKRHYRDDLLKRFNEAFAFQSRFTPKNGLFKKQSVAAGTSIKQSALVTDTGRMPPREAQLIYALFTHPFLLDEHYDVVSKLDLKSQAAHQLLLLLLDAYAGVAEENDVNEVKMKFLSSLYLPLPASLLENAGKNDVFITFNQLMTLQNKQQALHKELLAAERAFAEDFSEENFSWLKDVKLRLSNIEGTEALVDGFGQ